MGGLIVEHMRAEATRQIVTDTQPHVNRVLQLVKRDFNPKEAHWSLGYDKVLVALDGAANRAEAISRVAGGAAAAPDPVTVALVGEARATRRRNAERFTAMAQQVLGATGKLAEAQKNLRYAVQSDTIGFDDVNDYVAQVEDFVRIYSILRDR